MSEIKILSAQEFREQNAVIVDFGDGTGVRAIKVDIVEQIMDGRLPIELVEAATRMEALPLGSTMTEKMDALGKQNSQTLLRIFREHAVTVCVEPRLTLQDDTDDKGILPVKFFSTEKLLAIWQQTVVTGAPLATPSVTQGSPEVVTH